MCNLVWFILALELPGQQWVAAIPSWKGQVLWVPFCFILSMVVLEHKVRWSYYLIPVFVGICFTLPNLLCPCCLSSWERLTAVTQATFTYPHCILAIIISRLCMETSPPQWSKTSKLGRASSCGGLRHCPRGLFCNIWHWTTERGGIFLFSGGDEGPDQLVEILNSLGGLLSDREEWILGQWEGVPSIPVCKLWMRKPGSKSFLQLQSTVLVTSVT